MNKELSGKSLPFDGWFDSSGDPMVGGRVYVYGDKSDDVVTTYTGACLGTKRTNPVILNSEGRPNGGGLLWVTDERTVRLEIFDLYGNLVMTFGGITPMPNKGKS